MALEAALSFPTSQSFDQAKVEAASPSEVVLESRPLWASFPQRLALLAGLFDIKSKVLELGTVEYLAPYLRGSRTVVAERAIEVAERDKSIFDQSIKMSIAIRNRRTEASAASGLPWIRH